MDHSQIPAKSSFNFKELISLTGVKSYVLRFWETEFNQISPQDSDSGQKVYSREDVEVILKIKSLLFDKKLNINEAKHFLETEQSDLEISLPSELNISLVQECLDQIQEIKNKYHW